MKFGAAYFSTLLWLIPIILIFFMWTNKLRKQQIKKFAEDGLIRHIAGSVSERKRKIKKTLLLGSLFFMIIACMMPRWGFTWHEVKRQGLDILIALDTSNSMLAEDVLPNRLERSKLAIKDLVKKLKGDRIGLIAFSGTAFLQCPLTIDYNGFLLSLEDVNVSTIPVGGTSLSNAIYTAEKSYEGGKKQHKILIVITDGEDLEGGVEGAVQSAKAEGITIFTVGIGTPTGELIPIRDESGKMTFLKDSEGNVVKTRLAEEELERIALTTGGIYVRSTGAEFGLDYIYENRLSKFEKEEFKSRMEKKYKERFQIPLAIAFIMLLAETLLSEKKSHFDPFKI